MRDLYLIINLPKTLLFFTFFHFFSFFSRREPLCPSVFRVNTPAIPDTRHVPRLSNAIPYRCVLSRMGWVHPQGHHFKGACRANMSVFGVQCVQKNANRTQIGRASGKANEKGVSWKRKSDIARGYGARNAGGRLQGDI